MENIILVYELVPENTRIYHLVVDTDTAQKIKATHLKFVNAESEVDECDWLLEYLVGKPFITSVEDGDDAPNIPHEGLPTTVVLSGFVL